ncbi:flagellar M-ring protein FliF (plasmid) [Sphingomonas paeninsulae]|uniref:Flagellar M-ring protein n=1 Tax=Sphingomonas paeninsulae TaxID=2319844 RepID=A0A494T7B5_SPHPE|nr:flagellar basal-body MS-ring/collar protein FliF [Sphingomonas paeninsulae]AYJ85227.1 flagellar M-ring protein FliF [Sphingomonas paeninsulae]
MATELISATIPGAGSLPGLVQLRSVIDQPLVRRSLPMLGLLGVALAAVFAWMAISAPAQRPLFTALADADKAGVAAALDTAGVKYKIDGDSGTLNVSGDDYHRARMLLAGQGLPKSAPTASASLDSLPMGASHALEGEHLRTARELDLARTVEAIDAVESAKIHLAVEPPSLFVRDRIKSSASVMVKLVNGRSLSDAQVQAVVHLVASSVSGLNADDVTVIDQAGHLLSLDMSNPLAAETARQLDVQNKVEARYRDAVMHILSPIVGPDGFTAEVHADLDFDEKQATREIYPESGRAVQLEQSHWTSATGEQPAVGIPGTLSNQPPPASSVTATPPASLTPSKAGAPVQPGTPTTAAANAQSVQPGVTPPGRTSEDTSKSYELGREVSVSKTASGQVRRLSVAVALRDGPKKRSGVELAALDGLVKGAIGFDATRGDNVTVSARPFQVATVDKPAWYDNAWLPTIGRNVAAIIVVALLIFGVGRPLLKRRAAASAARLTEIGTLIGQELNNNTTTGVTLDMIESTPSYADRVALVRDFVRANPARAALVVRQLVSEADNG